MSNPIESAKDSIKKNVESKIQKTANQAKEELNNAQKKLNELKKIKNVESIFNANGLAGLMNQLGNLSSVLNMMGLDKVVPKDVLTSTAGIMSLIQNLEAIAAKIKNISTDKSSVGKKSSDKQNIEAKKETTNHIEAAKKKMKEKVEEKINASKNVVSSKINLSSSKINLSSVNSVVKIASTAADTLGLSKVSKTLSNFSNMSNIVNTITTVTRNFNQISSMNVGTLNNNVNTSEPENGISYDNYFFSNDDPIFSYEDLPSYLEIDNINDSLLVTNAKQKAIIKWCQNNRPELLPIELRPEEDSTPET